MEGLWGSATLMCRWCIIITIHHSITNQDHNLRFLGPNSRSQQPPRAPGGHWRSPRSCDRGAGHGNLAIELETPAIGQGVHIKGKSSIGRGSGAMHSASDRPTKFCPPPPPPNPPTPHESGWVAGGPQGDSGAWVATRGCSRCCRLANRDSSFASAPFVVKPCFA